MGQSRAHFHAFHTLNNCWWWSATWLWLRTSKEFVASLMPGTIEVIKYTSQVAAIVWPPPRRSGARGTKRPHIEASVVDTSMHDAPANEAEDEGSEEDEGIHALRTAVDACGIEEGHAPNLEETMTMTLEEYELASGGVVEPPNPGDCEFADKCDESPNVGALVFLPYHSSTSRS